MASAPVEFQRQLTLRHIAAVKTIQMLWRQSDAKEDLKKVFQSQIEGTRLLDISRQKVLTPVIAKLESFLENLNIPGSMKTDLSVFLEEMIEEAVNWLEKTIDDMIFRHPDRNCLNKMAHFIDNFSWDDIGYVDSSSILKSYVNDKQTIDFDTWSQLCCHCLDEEIIKFSETIVWNNCRQFTASYFPIFWYHKIHGKFPTKKMFRSREFSDFERERRHGVYNKENIMKNLISESVSGGIISAVKYLRNSFESDDKFQRLFSEGEEFFRDYPAMMVYLLEEVKDEAFIQSFFDSGDVFANLEGWPWILFIDIWISKMENMKAEDFRLMFERIQEGVDWKRTKVGMKKFRKKQSKGIYGTRFYEPFRKLWGVFKQKFGAKHDKAREVFWRSIGMEDVKFCGIILEELEGEERRFFFDQLEAGEMYECCLFSNEDFWAELVREALVTNEEYELIQERFSDDSSED